MATLRKPPVIEAWIEFRFAPREDEPGWNQARAADFFGTVFDGVFSVRDYRIILNLQKPRDSDQPELKVSPRFDLARGPRPDEDRFLQAGRSRLIYNVLKKGSEWPGFVALRDEALEALTGYIKFSKPQSLRGVALNYRDIVTVPSENFDLEDYFRIRPVVPTETYRTLGRLAWDLSFEWEAPKVLLRIIMKSAPSREGLRESRFQIDWFVSSVENLLLNHEAIRGWLDAAHDVVIRKAFRGAFTDQGWALFEPKEGE